MVPLVSSETTGNQERDVVRTLLQRRDDNEEI